jgi:eukaryotic translation initiation factor 2C
MPTQACPTTRVPLVTNTLFTQTRDLFGSIGELVNVQGRFLQHLRVYYDRQPADYVQANKPTWVVAAKKMSIGARLSNWAIVFVSVNKQSQGTWKPYDGGRWAPVVQALAKEFKRMNVVTSDYGKVVHWDLSSEADRGLGGKMAAMGGKHLVVFLFNESAVLFSHIKRHGDVLCGVPTTCVRASKIEIQAQSRWDNNLLQYMSNVALKVNLKGSGVNQKLLTPTASTTTRSQGVPKMPMGGVVLPSRHKPGTSAAKPTFKPDPNFANESFFEPFKGEPTMVVGIDVTHPAPGDSPLTPSVAGMVASVDHHLGQWPAVLRVQNRKEEMVKKLGEMLGTRLEVWLGKNKVLPRNILIYRDGVSEGQYTEVIEDEYKQLHDDCLVEYNKKGLPEPRITIVVAGKRHHTRFYPVATSSEDADKSGNTKAGLVVDRGVTEVRNWDFYLQAHAAIQGTVRPVHYYVVHDDIFTFYHKRHAAANQLESVTHQLSYLFGRATLAVSLCAPVYYAHLACERARVLLCHARTKGQLDMSDKISDEMLKKMQEAVEINPKLANTMYYI